MDKNLQEICEGFCCSVSDPAMDQNTPVIKPDLSNPCALS